MEDKRLQNNNRAYFIDSYIGKSKPFVRPGFLMYVDKETGRFTIARYHDEYHSFCVNDIGKTVFFTWDEAEEFIDRLPEVGQTVFTQDSNGELTEDVVEYFIVPKMHLKSGKIVLITEVGQSIFTSKDIRK